MSLEDFLDRTADVLVQANGQVDAVGGVVRSPYTVAVEAEPCCLRPLSAGKAPRNNRAELLASHRVYFGRDLGLTGKHQLRIGARIFVVVSPVDANSRGELLAVDCLEVV